MHELLELRNQLNKPLAEICNEKYLIKNIEIKKELQIQANEIFNKFYYKILDVILEALSKEESYCKVYVKDIFCSKQLEPSERIYYQMIIDKLEKEKFKINRDFEPITYDFYLVISWDDKITQT